MKKIAQIISIIFHPVFTPLLAFFIIKELSSTLLYIPPYISKLIIATLVIFTFIIPLASVYILQWKGDIKSIYLESKKERLVPLFINLMSFSTCYFLFKIFNYPNIILQFVLAFLVSNLLAFIISFKHKISLHSMAWGTLTAIIISYSLKYNWNAVFLLSLVILIWSIVASARLYLNTHSAREVYLGFFIGFIINFLNIMCLYD